MYSTTTRNFKVLARNPRRRDRAGRRAAQWQASNDRDRARGKNLIVSRAAEALGVYQEMGCEIVGLQETRRSDQSALLQAGYEAYCSGESGGDGRGEKAKLELDWLFARGTPVPRLHQWQATEDGA